MSKRSIVLALSCLLAAYGVVVGSGLGFEADLSTAQEIGTPVGVTITDAEVEIEFAEDLSSAAVRLTVVPSTNVVAAHFHCNVPGANGPVAFGLLSPGTFTFDGDVAEGTISNADFTGANCVPLVGRPINTIAALALGMREGLVYANIHTVANPGGEVRGQMLPADADEDGDGDGDDDEDNDGGAEWEMESDAPHAPGTQHFSVAR